MSRTSQLRADKPLYRGKLTFRRKDGTPGDDVVWVGPYNDPAHVKGMRTRTAHYKNYTWELVEFEVQEAHPDWITILVDKP